MKHGLQRRFLWILCCIVAFTAMSPPLAMASVAGRHGGQRLKDLKELEDYVSNAEAKVRALHHPSRAELTSARHPILGGMQALAAEQSFLGDPVAAVSTFNEEARLWNRWIEMPAPVGNRQADIRAIESSHAVDALAAITAAAEHRQIVILNEAHHVAYDRLFAEQLAARLKKLGFTYLACETFDGSSDRILSEGYVSQMTGHYSQEPTFVGFLSEAIRDGWKFVSYEPDPSDGGREFAMAQNIRRRVLAKDPHAKIFIYVGYSHGQKFPPSTSDVDGTKFAAQLKRQTGIDPLTIDQTILFDHYSSDQQASYYALASKKLHGSNPAVLVLPNGTNLRFSAPEMAYDFQVVHPRYAINPATQRPTWMDGLLTSGRTARDIPVDMASVTAPRVVYAYRAASPADAEPYDVVTLTPGKPVPKMILPAGEFEFEVEE